MTDILEKAKEQLHNEKLSIVIVGSETYTSTKRGVEPLLNILDENSSLINGSRIADKVVGKAAALLMIVGGVCEVYADVISTHAIAVFENNGVVIYYRECVPYIVNRDKTGMCPMENAVLNIDEPKEAVSVLKKKLEQMKK